jgi:REP element-mobilizing transposase RayT
LIGGLKGRDLGRRGPVHNHIAHRWRAGFQRAHTQALPWAEESCAVGADEIINHTTHPPMPQSLSRVLIHLVFSTKNREPVITPKIITELHPYIAGTLDNIDCPSLRVGGVADHVHLFFGLSRTRTIAEVVETVKTSSSKWIKTKGPEFSGFHWQSGYGAFSVSQSDADTVVNYVANQESHHQKMTFQDEYRKLLEKYRVTFDEKYVWD